jgi:RNase P subunit RPR2
MRTKKYCPECRRNLYVNSFQRNASRADGLQVYCRECQNTRNLNLADRFPQKVKARQAVAAAIKHGDMTRGTHCEACASTENIDAHHENYRNPLDVIWLCRSCHQQVHNWNMKDVGAIRSDIHGETGDAILDNLILWAIEGNTDEAVA